MLTQQYNGIKKQLQVATVVRTVKLVIYMLMDIIRSKI